MIVSPRILKKSISLQLPLTAILLLSSIALAGIVMGRDSQAISTQSNRVTKVQIVVAARNIFPGEEFSEDALKTLIVPSGGLEPGIFRSTNKVLGHKARAFVPTSTPIGDWLLAEVGEAQESESTLGEINP